MIKEKIFCPFNNSLPFKSTSSIKKAHPTTSPPNSFTKEIVASTVPPVASKSSTITTLSPGLIASS